MPVAEVAHGIGLGVDDVDGVVPVPLLDEGRDRGESSANCDRGGSTWPDWLL